MYLLLLCATAVLAKPEITYTLDRAATRIEWKGTKAFGLRSHAGIVRAMDGRILLRDGSLTGGVVTVDMRTIEVTDIPPSDPVPRQRIRDHLMNEDFFDVEHHPTATLRIIGEEQRRGPTRNVIADLTVRGITHRITFPATVQAISPTRLHVTAELELDRRRWGANFSGRIGNALVDDTFTLRLNVIANTIGART